MPKAARALVLLAALLLLAVFAFPLWRIALQAPQYPEGLGMRIHVSTIVGATEHDLTNINNLNHYIGMKAIEPDAIPELRFMSWIVGALVAGALAVAALGRRLPLYLWVGGFAAAGLAGLADFWRWTYDYGHNLDEATAIIKIPGMTYQPPIIGTKQLLNFTASSWPDVGGVAAGLAFLCGAAAVMLTVRAARSGRGRTVVAALAVAATTACASGAATPEGLHYGTDECAYCRMTVSDERYGARAVTGTGRTLAFDSVECLASWVAAQDPATVRGAWVTDFDRPGTLVPARTAHFVRGGTQHSPMGLGLTAFDAAAQPAEIERRFGGEALDWAAVLELVREESARRAPAGAAHDAHRDASDAADG